MQLLPVGQGRDEDEMRKTWNVGQGDLCRAKVFDNLSELEVARG